MNDEKEYGRVFLDETPANFSGAYVSRQRRMAAWLEDGKANLWKARCRNFRKETAEERGGL